MMKLKGVQVSLLTMIKTASDFIKKYWQFFAGFFTVILAVLLKKKNDSNVKKETLKEVEHAVLEQSAIEQKHLNEISESTIISHLDNPLPASWDKLKLMSEKTSPTAKQKAAYDKIRKKLRRKN